ncbi:hypothetical protein [Escherichia coli]|uniref:hypothetical protein n=1 Tax=Escherichia coli TaxID=562 RepID=UPI00202363A9|nr:hypothetical protein [Escherichia coli]
MSWFVGPKGWCGVPLNAMVRWAWVINSSLAAAKPSSPFLVTRASRELPLINDVTEQYAKRIALAALQNEEPVGTALLAKMAG